MKKQLSMLNKLYEDDISRAKFYEFSSKLMSNLKYITTTMEGIYMITATPSVKQRLGRAMDHMNNAKFYLASVNYFICRNHPDFRDKSKDWFLKQATQPDMYAQPHLSVREITEAISNATSYSRSMFKGFRKYTSKKQNWCDYMLESLKLAKDALHVV